MATNLPKCKKKKNELPRECNGLTGFHFDNGWYNLTKEFNLK